MINSEYLFSFLASPTIQDGFEDRASGTTNQIELATSTVKNQVIPLAPFAEQKRIVAKVDQLMHLCDQLDACQEKAFTKYTSLNDAALEKLLSSKSIDEFANHWQFLCDNFDLIYNDPAHANKLRQAILQLAVQGKLAPQDLNDEPANELLKRIKAEKERLIAEGKIKKQKHLPPITEDEISYELPKGWCWMYLPDMASFEKNAIKRGPFGSAIRKEFFVPDGYKVYEQRNAIYDDFTLGTYFIDEKKFLEMKSFEIKPQDIIISCSGTIGKVAIAPKEIKQGIINQALLKITLNGEVVINEYFKILFEVFVMKSNVLRDLKGTAMKNITSVKILKTLPLPIPSKNEQKRIVAKVNQLMHLCDELETRLSQSKKDSEMLIQAVLHEAFS
jgi:type I restriction enzyme S subunit